MDLNASVLNGSAHQESLIQPVQTSSPSIPGVMCGALLSQEGEEPEAFWSALGGRGEYPKVSSRRVHAPPLMFHIRDAASKWRPACMCLHVIAFSTCCASLPHTLPHPLPHPRITPPCCPTVPQAIPLKCLLLPACCPIQLAHSPSFVTLLPCCRPCSPRGVQGGGARGVQPGGAVPQRRRPAGRRRGRVCVGGAAGACFVWVGAGLDAIRWSDTMAL